MQEQVATGLTTVRLATELTLAWLRNPNSRISADLVPGFLELMHATVQNKLGATAAPVEPIPAPEHIPAVSVRKSLASKEHILSMIDGKPYRTLRQHLSRNGLTPEQYRERYSLRPDYPMVAEAYSERRRAIAKRIGLGRKPQAKPSPAGGRRKSR